MSEPPRPSLGLALRRGLAKRCPNCGQGRLLCSYLKPVEACAQCGQAYGHIKSDDAAPWLTILVVGHITVPLVLAVEKHDYWPTWMAMTVWPVLVVGLALLILPYAKALFISAIWATGAPGRD